MLCALGGALAVMVWTSPALASRPVPIWMVKGKTLYLRLAALPGDPGRFTHRSGTVYAYAPTIPRPVMVPVGFGRAKSISGDYLLVDLVAKTDEVSNRNYFGFLPPGIKDSQAARQRVSPGLPLDPPAPGPREKGPLGQRLEQVRQMVSSNPAAALEFIARLKAERPGWGALHHQAGRALVKQKRLDAALNEFNRAVELEPSLAEAYYNIGWIMQKRRDLLGALLAYRKVIELNPPFVADALVNLAVCYQAMGRAKDAVAALKKALIKAPGHRLASRNLHKYKGQKVRPGKGGAGQKEIKSAAAILRKDPARALAILDRLAAKRPDWARLHLERGRALTLLKRRKEALRAFDKAARLQPLSAAAQYNRGLVLQRLDRFNEASLAYQKVLRLKPSWVADAMVNLAICYYYLGKPSQALATLQKALKKQPGHALAQKTLARLKAKTK